MSLTTRPLSALASVLLASAVAAAPVDPTLLRAVATGEPEAELTLRGDELDGIAEAIVEADPNADALAGAVAGLDEVQVLVMPVAAGDAAVEASIDQLRGELVDDGWEQLARVRGDESVVVLVRPGADGLDGATVVVHDGTELVFVHLSGRLELGVLGTLGDVDFQKIEQQLGTLFGD